MSKQGYWEYDFIYDGFRVPVRGDNVSQCGTEKELFAKTGERGRGPGDRLTVVGVDNMHRFKDRWHCWKVKMVWKEVEA